MIKYPIYRINSQLIIFGSCHDKKIDTIPENIQKTLLEFKKVFFECDFTYLKDVIFEKRYNISNKLPNSENIKMFFDSINEEKEIKECKWYEISAGFMYDYDYLETLSKKNYFMKNLGKVNIKNINFTEIAKFQLCTTNYNGIDHHLAHLFINKSSDINSLDENNSEIVSFFQNYLKFILYSILFIKRIFGKDIKNFNINTDTNIDLIENADKITINNSLIVNKRNELWFPKIRNEIQEKTLIVVGAAHVKEIVEKFKYEGYKIEKYNYIKNKFILV